MSNNETYAKIFRECFGLDENFDLEGLEYQGVTDWDSVGHMDLVAELEDNFHIMLDTDDIIDFSSFKKGKEILSKYHIVFE